MKTPHSSALPSSTPAALGWELWRSFLAVVHTGSLSGAARALGLTQPSVGRHIQQLEAGLGTVLFTRSRHGLNPTDLAQSLIPQAEVMASAAEQLMRTASASQGEVSGTVRVAASEMMGTLVLPPMLSAFREVYPQVAIELSLSNRNEDLLQRDADIAIRMQRPSQAALVARHIGSVRVGLFAHVDYVRKHGQPACVEALSDHPLIGVDKELRALAHPGLSEHGLARESFSFRCDSDVAQFMAMKAGFGIGACHLPLACLEPQCLPVLADSVGWSYEVWLVMHEDQRKTPRIYTLFEHLAAELSVYVGS
ncbi:LysR family transcriptional regulator [Alcaligenes sp. SORT26]|uniref:LysR family transcriptional regulator n=1 Tax=Alcaligenes sp. SORT26 TaxID=2813780 RepID=UPI001A9DD40F|nr:LysR family transcriptional regulator [Alcaligenes sp. SORT26]QTC00977.1 LysR family transcriptional regulator [Alcaligenes sp. SORT26]